MDLVKNVDKSDNDVEVVYHLLLCYPVHKCAAKLVLKVAILITWIMQITILLGHYWPNITVAQSWTILPFILDNLYWILLVNINLEWQVEIFWQISQCLELSLVHAMEKDQFYCSVQKQFTLNSYNHQLCNFYFTVHLNNSVVSFHLKWGQHTQRPSQVFRNSMRKCSLKGSKNVQIPILEDHEFFLVKSALYYNSKPILLFSGWK